MVRNIFDFIGLIMMFIDRFLIPLIFAIAFLVFLWGLYTYFIAGGANEEKREQGKKLALWGIIGFVLMIAVWGIVGLLLNSLGFNTQGRPPLPTFGNSAPSQQVRPSTVFQGNPITNTNTNTNTNQPTTPPQGAPIGNPTTNTPVTGPAGTCDPTTCAGVCEPDGSCNPLY